MSKVFQVTIDARDPGSLGAFWAEALKVDADRLVGLGATLVRETLTQVDHFLVMQDPEGNEFCLT